MWYVLRMRRGMSSPTTSYMVDIRLEVLIRRHPSAEALRQPYHIVASLFLRRLIRTPSAIFLTPSQPISFSSSSFWCEISEMRFWFFFFALRFLVDIVHPPPFSNQMFLNQCIWVIQSYYLTTWTNARFPPTNSPTLLSLGGVPHKGANDLVCSKFFAEVLQHCDVHPDSENA